MICSECGYRSKKFESTICLSLEIPGHISTLKGALDLHCAEEALDGLNKYQCDCCRNKVGSTAVSLYSQPFLHLGSSSADSLISSLFPPPFPLATTLIHSLSSEFGPRSPALFPITPTRLGNYSMLLFSGQVRAVKSSLFEVAPNVLVLALKRFSVGRFGKLNKKVMLTPTLPFHSWVNRSIPHHKVFVSAALPGSLCHSSLIYHRVASLAPLP